MFRRLGKKLLTILKETLILSDEDMDDDEEYAWF